MFHWCRQFILNVSPDGTSTTFLERVCFSLRNHEYSSCNLPKYFFKAIYQSLLSSYMYFSYMFLFAVFSRYAEYLNVLEFNSVLTLPHYDIHMPSNPPFKGILFSCLQLKSLSTMLLGGRHVSGTYLWTKLPLLPEEESRTEESEDCQAFLLLAFYELIAMVPAVDYTSDLLLTWAPWNH